ncbi:MFS transporter [Ciceribacter sp. L1K23]|uniref:MFS transporter n=1 Tax=Ciceribacter sp. L1K23 TaxID=2820276 RepID=UPI001B81A928|nr:MFS transporter [Ciceribacter sp. L1K23]MBR0556355.1 MFS transporter [Ciceribacter sp. L1K23]
MPPRLRLIATLSLSQILGWGTTFDMPGVFGRTIASELSMANETAFAGLTVMMLVTAFAGPATGRLVERLGAARVLACGSALFGLGLLLMAAATGPILYFAAWLLIGFGSAFGLSVPCYAAVVEREGADAKRAIGILMIFTGLSATVCWPLLSLGQDWIGWRWTLTIAALIHLVALVPLHLFGLPAVQGRTAEAAAASQAEPLALSPRQSKRALVLIAIVTIAFSLVTMGIAPSLIELITQAGATPELALQLGALRSVFGISARAIDTVAGRRASPLFTGYAAAILMLAALPILAFSGGEPWLLLAFVACYGFGSGVSALSRALLPLGFFSPGRYARISANLSLPANLAMAAAPVVSTFLLDRGGATALLVYCAGLCLITLAALAGLSLIRRQAR